MYTFSRKLKTFSFALMIVGLLGVGYSFLSTPNSVEDVKVMLQDSHDTHSEVEKSNENDTHAVESGTKEAAHADTDDAHAEHVLHLLKNKPWSALYVALFFFFMISLGTLVFYAIQHAAQAGWSVVLFRVMEAITASLSMFSFGKITLKLF